MIGISEVLVLVGMLGGPGVQSEARLEPVVTAQSSAGNAANLAVDVDESTYWLSQDRSANQAVNMQLDFGKQTPIERIHWVARNKPADAVWPTEVTAQTSIDGSSWATLPISMNESITGQFGNIFVRRSVRYVRFALNSSSAGKICIDEIWGIPGLMAEQIQYRPVVNVSEGQVALSWSVPTAIHPAQVRLLKGDLPTADRLRSYQTFPISTKNYVDNIPDWTPTYYQLEYENSYGEALFRTAPAVAVAHAPLPLQPYETVGFYYDTYKPLTDADPTAPKLKGIPLVTAAAEHASELGAQGTAAITYIQMYQSEPHPLTEPRDQLAKELAPEAFFRHGMQYPDSPPGYAPSNFSRPGNPEYNAKALTYIQDPNSTSLRSRIMATVRDQLHKGGSGFFVDNGFSDSDIGTSMCESTSHAHTFGPMTAGDAYLGFLIEVRSEIKKANPNGVMIVNGGVIRGADFCGQGFWDVIDGFLQEGFIYQNLANAHVSPWAGEYAKAKGFETFRGQHNYSSSAYIMSYPWSRDEAYMAYCTVKLCNLPYAAFAGEAPGTLHRDTSIWPELLRIQLGPANDPHQYGGATSGAVYYRQYQNGVVLVNPTNTPQAVSLSLGGTQTYTDLYSGTKTTSDSISMTLPPMSGRVELFSM